MKAYRKIPFGKIVIALTIFLLFGIKLFYDTTKKNVINDSQTQTLMMIQLMTKQKSTVLTSIVDDWYRDSEKIATQCINSDGALDMDYILTLAEINGPNIFAFDTAGNVLSNSETNYTVKRQELELVLSGKRIIANNMLEIDETSQKISFEIIVPIKNLNGIVLGGIVNPYNSTELEKLLVSPELSKLGNTIIIDHEERILVGTNDLKFSSYLFDNTFDDSIILNKNALDKMRKEIVSGKSNFVKSANGKGYVLYEFNPVSGFIIVSMVDEDALASYSSKITGRLQDLLLGSIVFAGIMYSIILMFYLVIARMLNERSEFLNAKNKELTELTSRDPMTGLFNKSSATSMITKILEESPPEQVHALFFVDIDNFKTINDKHGHDEGDQLIIQFAEILKSYFREDNIVARFGGDEFIVFVKNIKYASALDQIAERLCKYIYIKSNEKKHYSFSTSIGVAISPKHGTSCDELMQNADKALYFSKNKGKNTFHIYDKKLDDYMVTI